MLAITYQKKLLEAGTDEAGRGCLAGPVFAAAVILPVDFEIAEINDSKKMSESKRYELRSLIEKYALAWAVAYCTNQEIDRWNILKASIYAMHRSLDRLQHVPQLIVVDGNRFYPYKNIPFKTIIKGDATYMNIAAASILAKTYRDDFMNKIHKEYPMYRWNENKGYPTEAHIQAIEKYGLSPYHRRSFQVKSMQLRLF